MPTKEELMGGVNITEHRKNVIRWLARGKSNEEIGLLMGCSPLTVKNHVVVIATAYGVAGGGTGSRLRVVMAALVRGDISMEEFREDYKKCIANGTVKREAQA